MTCLTYFKVMSAKNGLDCLLTYTYYINIHKTKGGPHTFELSFLDHISVSILLQGYSRVLFLLQEQHIPYRKTCKYGLRRSNV